MHCISTSSQPVARPVHLHHDLPLTLPLQAHSASSPEQKYPKINIPLRQILYGTLPDHADMPGPNM